VLFWLWDRGKEKKICNSQCFYFHICDIEIFGEIFPLNSEIGQNYNKKRRSSKISQKTIYCQKKKKSFFKKKVGEDRPSDSSQSLPFLEENLSVVL
jgi:hypothetical protein